MPGAFNEYDNEQDYQRALADWQAAKQRGDPFPGPTPQRSARLSAEVAVKDAGFNPAIRNFDTYNAMTRFGANASSRANPYSDVIANRTREGQLALLQQMRAGGPSIAAMQGAQGMSNALAQAAAAQGRGGSLGAMRGLGMAGAGMAGDVARARLAEQMAQQQALAQGATGLRSHDIGVAGASAQDAAQMRALDDARTRFYASQGAGLQSAQDRANLELFKLKQRKFLEDRERQLKALSNVAGGWATTASNLSTGGK